MAKKRTRKQKSVAKHTFTYSWPNEHKNDDKVKTVNRQLTKTNFETDVPEDRTKYAKITADNTSYAHIKRDIVRSLLFTGLILGTELMLYLFW